MSIKGSREKVGAKTNIKPPAQGGKPFPSLPWSHFSFFLNPQHRTPQVGGIGAREGTKNRDLFLLQKKKNPKREGKKAQDGKKEPKLKLLAALPQQVLKRLRRETKEKYFPLKKHS